MAKKSNSFNKRLRMELDDIMRNPPPLCSAGLESDNIRTWIATIQGPPDSPYEEGIFKLQIIFPDTYPFAPPEVQFLTKIYHCNIDYEGNICLDILSDKWSPALTVSSLLLSISLLLTNCNPKSPLNENAAALYMSNKALHDTNARTYTRKYAVS